MATFIHSKLSVFKMDNAAGSLTDISQYCNSVSFTREMEQADTTSFGSVYRSNIAGFTSWSLSVGGNWDRTFDGIMSGVANGFAAGTLLSVTIEYGPEGGEAGDVRYTGEATLVNYNPGSEVEDPVAWSAELQGTLALTVNTY